MKIRLYRHVLFIVAGLILAALCQTSASARDTLEISKTPPVAIVAAVQGDATIAYPSRQWQKCYPLDFVGPETKLKTGADGQILVVFLYDDHSELLGPNTQANVAFRNLARVAGRVTREGSRSGGQEFAVPILTTVKLFADAFKQADDPRELDKENDFMSAYVKVTTMPPVFYWRDLGLNHYRMQLFNERGEFIYETKVTKPNFKFPSRPPFRLMKSGLYHWQTLSPSDDVLVRKYPFMLLTLPQVKFLQRAEAQFAKAQAGRKGDSASFTEMFLVYNQYHTLDKLVHLLQNWQAADPENPNVYRFLVRAYLLKGCPLKARQSLQEEIRLGSPDPLGP